MKHASKILEEIFRNTVCWVSRRKTTKYVYSFIAPIHCLPWHLFSLIIYPELEFHATSPQCLLLCLMHLRRIFFRPNWNWKIRQTSSDIITVMISHQFPPKSLSLAISQLKLRAFVATINYVLNHNLFRSICSYKPQNRTNVFYPLCCLIKIFIL